MYVCVHVSVALLLSGPTNHNSPPLAAGRRYARRTGLLEVSTPPCRLKNIRASKKYSPNSELAFSLSHGLDFVSLCMSCAHGSLPNHLQLINHFSPPPTLVEQATAALLLRRFKAAVVVKDVKLRDPYMLYQVLSL